MDDKEGYQTKDGSEGKDATLAKVREMLPDAPEYVPPDLLVPPDYRIDTLGIFRVTRTRLGEVEKHIGHAPILITQKRRDRAGREAVVIAWRTDWWRKREVMRGELARTRDLLRLADVGFPVTSANVRELMDYLAAFEAANFDTLPVKQSAPLA